MKNNSTLITLISLIFFSCNDLKFETFTDPRDTRIYRSLNVGKNKWMADNLKAATFKNGDHIYEAKSFEDWAKAIDEKKPTFCYYNFDNSSDVGKIYNFYAIADKRSLAPNGWRIPSLIDWKSLFDSIPISNFTNKVELFYGPLSGYLDLTDRWFSFSNNGKFSDEFRGMNSNIQWWTSDMAGAGTLQYPFGKNGTMFPIPFIAQYNKGQKKLIVGNLGGFYDGYYVRCIKD